MAVFVLAGLCEIGGGYLIWQWLRAGKSGWWGAAGAVLLVLYGMVATRQDATFGKTYAVYGAIFIVMSLAWAQYFDQFRPDKFDVIGGAITLLGVGVILFWPRG